MAAKGIVFNNAYCSSPVCRSSREAFLTGLRPDVSGVTDNLTGFFRDKPGLKNWITMPQYFRKHGYEAIAAGKILHQPAGSDENIPHPDSDPVSWNTQRIGNMGTPDPPSDSARPFGMKTGPAGEGLDDYFGRVFDFVPLDVPKEDTEDWGIASYIADELSKERDKPFFLACGIYRPHLPWYAPREFFDMFPRDSVLIPEVLENDTGDLPPEGKARIRYKGGVHAEVLRTNCWKDAVRGYQACISFADACAGKVLDALENSKYKDNTIVVIMGDHGFHLGEKNHWEKLAMWERATKTTLIIYDPSTRVKGVSKTVVSLQDIYPTLLELTALPPKNDIAGRSLKQIMYKPEDEYTGYALTTHFERHALRTNRYRYILYPNGDEELYDHFNDPNEWYNLAGNAEIKTVKKELAVKMESILAGREYPIIDNEQ